MLKWYKRTSGFLKGEFIINRLDTIVSLLPKCDTVVDIGCDHAYVPIKLIKNNIAKKCIACDLRKGPLEVAKKNIQQNGMCDKIETRLGFGLSIINKFEADCIIIAGMGGTLIRNILEEGSDKISPNSVIITQPNIYQQDVRKWFYQNNYDIYKEKLVLEDKRMYNIICAQFKKEQDQIDPFLYYTGDKLKQDPLYGVYIRNMLKKYKKALNDMDKMRDKQSSRREKYKWIVDRLNKESNNIL